jgi:SAM-dependent methyltransferase
VIFMEPDERVRHGSSFGAAAAAYAEHRPDYAEAAVRWALAPAPGPRVLDLAAGTGKLTATLVSLGADVTAVEPDPAMLGELRRLLPGVPAVPGSAEAIPLADGCVDAVLVGQALHWFDQALAGPEIARVLVPGGVLAALWNASDDRVDWVAGLDRVSDGAANLTLTGWRTGSDHGQHTAGLDLPALFSAPERAEFAHAQTRTASSMLATVATHSRVLVMDDEERDVLLSRVRDFLTSRPETGGGEFVLPIVTGVLRSFRL